MASTLGLIQLGY